MKYATFLVTIALVTLFDIACDDPTLALQADAPTLAANTLGAAAALGSTDRIVNIFDACDPESFNAVLGAGACQRSGGISFASFNELLDKHQEVGAWHFAPSVLQVKVGQSFTAVNRGGEEHTFTEVEEFGGGMVPELNEASGNPVPAPECLELPADDRLSPGETDTDEAEEVGTELYQCCIHPWMRAQVNVR